VAAGLAPSLGLFRRPGPREWDRVEAALTAVGLDHLAGECLFELSGGQQQRAILARALVADPRLLLLDEPTTGIDRRLRPVLVEELRRRTERGATVLAVSHDPDELRPPGVRLLVMENGRAREAEPAR
jgi:ABC-type Mn2+/Zn2+ transport system ATPase subunit